ncbi:integrase core domain-containing protein [Deinococcus taklimakanensis]|uniref:Integrase core domain-containing protein n=1 Tax=Deinococcus taklimakanensis TaxID=536443 RepID=A0ABW5P1S9_9DEIO
MEPNTKAELSALCAEFRTWYHTVRPHSALGYDCPWANLLEVAESLGGRVSQGLSLSNNGSCSFEVTKKDPPKMGL